MVSYLYRGISFPFTKGETSFPEAAVDNDVIKQSLYQIVLTGPGERVMRPGFGTSAHKYVFENNDDLLSELVRTEVSASVGRYEPRVALRDIIVARSEDLTEITVTLIYVIIATRTQDSVQIRVPGK